jgi:hypothetical protein
MLLRFNKTNKYIQTLTNPPKELLIAAGEMVTGELVKLWQDGRGGDGVPMKGYTYAYSKKKIKDNHFVFDISVQEQMHKHRKFSK